MLPASKIFITHLLKLLTQHKIKAKVKLKSPWLLLYDFFVILPITVQRIKKTMFAATIVEPTGVL